MYSQIPLRRFDGADITAKSSLGEVLIRGQLFVGQAREKIFENLEPDARDTVGVSLALERDIATVRLSHVSTEVDLDSGNLSVARIRAGIAEASATVPTLAALADDFAGKRVPLRFDSLALGLQFDRVFVDAELARRRIENWVPDVDSWSIALGTRIGTRFGAIRPYLFVSDNREADGDRRVDLPDDPSLDALEAGINQFYEPRDQRTIGVGARWNISDRLALKSQIDRISREVRGISFLRATVDDGSDSGDDVTLFSVALDFIF